jgi:hypothetical protein
MGKKKDLPGFPEKSFESSYIWGRNKVKCADSEKSPPMHINAD